MRFAQARPFVTLGVVLLAWALLPTVFKRFARLSFYELQAPVEVAASYVRDLQDYWSQRTRSKTELIEASRELARLNASYELRLGEDARLRAEITRLEALLRLPSYGEYRAEPARVTRRDFTVWWQRMVIRKGENHGIKIGSPVIYTGGLVGRVVEVHSTTSVVELLGSPGLRLAAVFEGDDRPVSFQGGANPPLRPAEGLLEFVPLDLFATPSAPRRLVTSGLGGVYPPGLYIGEVWQLEPSTDGLFKTGRARLDPRLGRITEVTVLVPLDPHFKVAP
ncbi:MAG: rod shape-determining protein MreC [Opitutaceae bacterium]|jgi:rod shape-determining protein MreC|nr:rod shape-determining protein MreC [Opitutaceae bacterium]